MKPYTDKLVAEWDLDEERAKAWAAFAKKHLVPPLVPSVGFKASPDQMFLWLAEVLGEFAKLDDIAAVEIAREVDTVIEPYIEAWFGDPQNGGYPRIESES